MALKYKFARTCLAACDSFVWVLKQLRVRPESDSKQDSCLCAFHWQHSQQFVIEHIKSIRILVNRDFVQTSVAVAGPRRQLAAYCSQGLGATTSEVLPLSDKTSKIHWISLAI